MIKKINVLSEKEIQRLLEALINNEPTYQYVIKNDGIKHFVGHIKYNDLIDNGNISIVKYKNENKIEFYITRITGDCLEDNLFDIRNGILIPNIRRFSNSKFVSAEYYDNSLDFKINDNIEIELCDIEEYLIKINFVYEKYTKEDLDFILEQFEKDYDESLKLSKTKE